MAIRGEDRIWDAGALSCGRPDRTFDSSAGNRRSSPRSALWRCSNRYRTGTRVQGGGQHRRKRSWSRSWSPRHVALGLGQLTLAIDAVVTLIAAFVFGPELALYGAVAIFVSGGVIDLVLEGLPVNKAAFIVSEHSGRIADAIIHDLGRGATALAARGVYSGVSREIVFTVVYRNEIDQLKSDREHCGPRRPPHHLRCSRGDRRRIQADGSLWLWIRHHKSGRSRLTRSRCAAISWR